MTFDEAAAQAVARELAELVLERVAKDELQFASFCLGLHLDDEAMAAAGWLDRYRSTIKKLAGTALGMKWPERSVDLERAEAIFIYDPRTKHLDVRLRPVFVYGRYRKLRRGLPQTRWHCHTCGGHGCKKCQGKGRAREGSVEEQIGDPVARAFRATGEPLLHGMGREDIDVRMLGGGRPFVLEVVSPRSRHVDLSAVVLGEGVELAAPLREASGELVARLKTLDPDKSYRALCRAESDLDEARVAALAPALLATEILQRTPQRVKSRADKIRPRRLLACTAKVNSSRELELELTTESGTYIKELVSGDEGRTSPSVAELLGVKIEVVELDVLDILITDEAVYAKPKP
jgi:tRNA pseudouridine synthase 10